MRDVHVIDHPLVQHKLTLMRRKETSTNTFRRLANEMATLLAYEVLRDTPTHEVAVETPLETTSGTVIDGKKLVIVSIMRAGTGILDGMLTVVPGARIGHIGLYRDPKKTLWPLSTTSRCPAICTSAKWSWSTPPCSLPVTRRWLRWTGSRNSGPPAPSSSPAC